MNKYFNSVIIALAIIISVPAHLYSQGGVSISTGASTPDPSAGLDLQFNNKGLLIPRLTTTERNSIPSPADGLMIFNTTTNCFEAYVLGTWSTMSCPANCFVPDSPDYIYGNPYTCNSNTETYNISQVNSATTYTWSLPNGWTILSGQGSTQITVTTGATNQNGDISVTANNTCGASAAEILSVTVTELPANAGVISGATVVCQSQTGVVYTVPPIPYATSYIWTLPGGAVGYSSTNTISVDYGANASSGDISVKGYNDPCGEGVESTLAVTVNTTPSTPGNISGAAFVCTPTTETYTVPPVAGATSYIWTLPSGATGSSTTNSITVNFSNSTIPGNITVKGYNATCGEGPESSLTLTVNIGLGIGCPYAGGIVFYLDGTGNHGLVCAPDDEGASEWGCKGTSIGGTSTNFGTGNANTTAIVNGCSTPGIAARVCYNLVLNAYSDWYLPSKDELGLMFTNLNPLGIGNFQSAPYWSSSQYNADVAWFWYTGYFPTPPTNWDSGKASTHYRIRPIRSF